MSALKRIEDVRIHRARKFKERTNLLSNIQRRGQVATQKANGIGALTNWGVQKERGVRT